MILRYQETPSPEIPPPRIKIQTKNKIFYPTFSFTQRTRSSDTHIEKNIEIVTARPSTGPHVTRRRITKTFAKSDINIVRPNFDPPISEFNDLETQSIRPFYVKIRPGLERIKRYFHNSADIS